MTTEGPEQNGVEKTPEKLIAEAFGEIESNLGDLPPVGERDETSARDIYEASRDEIFSNVRVINETISANPELLTPDFRVRAIGINGMIESDLPEEQNLELINVD